MEKLLMCRICLAENVRMYVVFNRHLHELYEKLTYIPFVTKDSRPMLACFFCCAKLKHCYRLLRQCLQAEELFAQMMNEDYEPSSLINKNHFEFVSGFIKSPIEHLCIDDECQTESIAVKEELPAVCEALDDIIIEPKEEYEIEELEPDNLDNCLYVADVRPHNCESDLEDDEPLLKLKIEVEEEQEVSKKKRRASETRTEDSRPKFHLICKLRLEFWKRWSQEYIAELQQRSKWKTPSIGPRIGDMVLIRDQNLPPQCWRLGRITRLHMGADNTCRVVDIYTSKGTIRRAIHYIIRLPGEEESIES